MNSRHPPPTNSLALPSSHLHVVPAVVGGAGQHLGIALGSAVQAQPARLAAVERVLQVHGAVEEHGALDPHIQHAAGWG